jgi:hypothetical protein
MKTSIVIVSLFLFCCPGCMMDKAGRLAGFSNPSSEVSYSWLTGFKAKTGADFSGSLKGDYNPETGQITVDANINSAVSPVVDAEGKRITPEFLELRKIESNFKNEQARIVGQNFEAFGSMLQTAIIAGGDAVGRVLDTSLPVLGATVTDMTSSITAPGVRPAPTFVTVEESDQMQQILAILRNLEARINSLESE